MRIGVNGGSLNQELVMRRMQGNTDRQLGVASGGGVKEWMGLSALEATDLASAPDFPVDRVAFGAVLPWKHALLERAARAFTAGAGTALAAPFKAFCRAETAWLGDFALFMALKAAPGGASSRDTVSSSNGSSNRPGISGT